MTTARVVRLALWLVVFAGIAVALALRVAIVVWLRGRFT